ncbi:MAG TPA: phospholipase D-like domain-containing protein [Candidatus Paceibacterota bacterium]|nr:phospholipase D-like domain-containing protein [Candidatus Paceibacterota bacterium]
MKAKVLRSLVALILAITAGGVGYTTGAERAAPAAGAAVSIPVQNVAAPAAGTTRVLYSLDTKQNDQELIALINAARDHVYFAIYTFTLPSVADALVAAKKRGVDVRGLTDSEQSTNSYGAPIAAKVRAAGIPLLTEQHASGNGIMHIKLLVTEQTYAFGSYNWTRSATTINDEILEIGTDPSLRQTYENILLKLFEAYKGTAAAGAAASVSGGVYDYTEAGKHIGEYASVHGTLVEAYTSKTGTVFLDFCKSYKTCPFSGVIFADDVKKFGGLAQYVGKTITVTGSISSYQGRAEIVLSDPSQISE